MNYIDNIKKYLPSFKLLNGFLVKMLSACACLCVLTNFILKNQKVKVCDFKSLDIVIC